MDQQEKEPNQKDGQKPKNTEKKARQFDFAAMFEETVAEARARNEQNESAQSADDDEETRARLRNIYIPSGGSSQDDEDEIGPPVPTGLANQNKGADGNDEDDFFPPLPPGFVPDTSVFAQDKEVQRPKAADDDEYEEPITLSSLIPAASEVVLKHSNKPVTAVCFDHQGTKFALGGYSYAVQFFDFQQMDSSLRPLKESYPVESHIINSLAFNINGENLLVASGNAQVKLLDRSGTDWCETVKGDQYLVDLANTKGHTAAVNCCCWHPLIKYEFMTCSDDGTIRIWNTDDYKEVTKCINTQRKVIKVRNAGGKKALPISCCYSNDGKLIAAGCDDGSVHIWKYGNVLVNPSYLNRTAHSGPISCVVFSPNNEKILTRSLDDTLKFWEIKNLKQPLRTAVGLSNIFPQTECGFSPHGEFIYTCTSEKSKAGESGALLFFNPDNFDLLYRINYDKAGCIRAAWHPKINQILVGLSDGTCRIYYDSTTSQRGIMPCITRPVRRNREAEVVKEEMILAPLSLEMFQPKGEDDEEKEVTEFRLRRYLRQLSANKRPNFRKPAEMPLEGASAGGRLQKGGGTLHSFIARELGVEKNKSLTQQDADVRNAILRHADEAEKDPQYINKAYKRTQPKPIFQDKTTEDEVEDDLEPVFKAPRMNQ